MIVTAVLATLLAQATVPMSPPVEQQTANCARPTFATDMLVCDDPELRALDERLRTIPPRPAAASELLEARADWFRRSRRCAFQADHRGCAVAAYREALAVQAPAVGDAAPVGRCRLRDGDAALVPVTGGAALVRDGRILGVGPAGTPPWQPFLRYEGASHRAVFQDLAGRVTARCTLRL